MRIFSIIAYFFIFINGWIIALPFVFLLIFGLFDSPPIMKVLILFADIALIFLGYISTKKNQNLLI
jgi:hypothetical protein